ncbi:MAG: glycosyltransferase family 2 protein [Termitinemataceae bacterium]|jgi:glycosyltransferase involved in cell wall biosynthesis|nr:MAG: glycosyltransferase family 2 protein [Termitinemataceae bacterium]
MLYLFKELDLSESFVLKGSGFTEKNEKNILVIIPAFNEEKNLEKVVGKLTEEHPQYDYVVINDGSLDGTAKICKNNNYNYIDLPVNLGIGGAVQCGFIYAKQRGYDVAVQIDGDGQHNPEFIDRMICVLEKQSVNMVIGSRFIEKQGFQSSALRRIGINLIRIVIYLVCKVRITDATSGFRAVDRQLINLFAENYAQDYPEPESVVLAGLNNLKVHEIPVIMNERQGGKSSINAISSVYYIFKVILALVICRMSKGRKNV